MKAIKKTVGVLNTLDKTFQEGIEVEIDENEYKYLSVTFGDIFEFSGVAEEKKEAPKETKKQNSK